MTGGRADTVRRILGWDHGEQNAAVVLDLVMLIEAAEVAERAAAVAYLYGQARSGLDPAEHPSAAATLGWAGRQLVNGEHVAAPGRTGDRG